MKCSCRLQWIGAHCNWSILLGSITRPFEKLVTSIRNETFSPTSYIPCAHTILFVGLSVCMRAVVISSLLEVTTLTRDSVFAGIVNCFAPRIVSCFYAPRLDFLCESALDILNRSLPVLKIDTGTERITMVFLSMEKSSLMFQSIYMMPSKMSTSKLWTA